MGVTEVFEGVRYGGREISQEEFNRLQEALDNLRELTFVGAGLGAGGRYGLAPVPLGVRFYRKRV